MKILIRGEKEYAWHLVESATYVNEAELQKLLAESPGLITIDDIRPESGPLVLAVREFNLPVGSIDLLAFSAGGDIAILECKLASNAEVKRKVIGQVLEYGANLWEMSYEDLDHGVRVRTGEPLADSMKNKLLDQDWDEEAFRSNIESSLENGHFILIIVVDQINEDLVRTVRFLNACSSANFEFAALEMRRFTAEHSEMLVPRVFGPSNVIKSKSIQPTSKQWDEASFFAELLTRNGEEAVNVARRILEWGTLNMEVWWGKGKQNGSFVPYFYHKDRQHQLFAVYTSGVVETYFYWYKNKPPFEPREKRLELRDKLNEIPEVDIPLEGIERRPSISLQTLAREGAVGQFLSVYDWVVEEIHKS
jgi:hypothetical protein